MAKLGIKHNLFSEVFFFPRKSKLTNFQDICTEIKTTRYCFKLFKVKKHKTKNCVQSFCSEM